MTTEQSVLYRLSDGRSHTIAGIAAFLRVSRRDVEAAIEALRLSGEPIIAGNDGVRYTTNPEEIRAYAKGRRSRLVSIARGTRRLLQTANRLAAPQRGFWG